MGDNLFTKRKNTAQNIRDVQAKLQEYRHGLAYHEVWGDSCLLRENKLYLYIRQEVLKRRFQFCSRQEIRSDLPAFCLLAKSQQERTIFYRPNAAKIRNMVRLAKGQIALDIFIAVNHSDISNMIYHDSAHGIMYDQLKSCFGAQFNNLNEHKKFFLQALGESFANTMEFLGFGYNRTHLAETLYGVNSIITFQGEEASRVREVCQQFKSADLFRLTFWCFVHHHYLFQELGAKDVNRIYHLSKIPKNRHKNRALYELFRQTRFNHSVVATTEQFYLDFLGFRRNLFDLSSFEFWNWMEQSTKLDNALEALFADLETEDFLIQSNVHGENRKGQSV